jgi:copper transport protein
MYKQKTGYVLMKYVFANKVWRRLLVLALPLACCLVLLLPATSEAHAILLQSDPANSAILKSPPSQVRMWFSEDLNPTFSTAQVISGGNRQRVDTQDAHVPSNNSREMDLSLSPNVAPGTYIVIWRTQSADDGHVLSGSFLFSVAAADGTVPQSSGATSIPNTLGATNAGGANGQLDGPTFFSFLMVTLVELGTIFWIGAQLWRMFVPPVEQDESNIFKELRQQEERRFERIFAIPVLVITFLANLGVLIGQGLVIASGKALSLSMLLGLASNGRFGTYWTVREIVIVLALLVAIYTFLAKKRSEIINSAIAWINLLLALGLLIAMTLSGHAAATNNNILVFAVLVDWLHLLAASLWVGGMMYIATTYLPTLRGCSLQERTASLLSVLPRYSPLAITGVIIMAVSGPFNATIHMSSWEQLFSTAYGRALVVKVLLVGALLITSAIHVRIFRPRLAKDYAKYAASVEASAEVAETETSENGETTTKIDEDTATDVKQEEQANASTEQVEQLEREVGKQATRLTKTLRWEPLLGIGVLLCTGLMNVFAGTLLPATPPPAPPPAQQQTQASKPFTTTVKTTDNQFTIQLKVSPNRFGPNTFTVKVLDKNGKPDTNVGVSIYTTMLDMDMGTQTVNLQPDNQGGFNANGFLDMSGDWQLRIQIRTPDFKLHEVKVKLVTPY